MQLLACSNYSGHFACSIKICSRQFFCCLIKLIIRIYGNNVSCPVQEVADQRVPEELIKLAMTVCVVCVWVCVVRVVRVGVCGGCGCVDC